MNVAARLDLYCIFLSILYIVFINVDFVNISTN